MFTNTWTTLELRWFHEGDIPKTIKSWFLSNERFKPALGSQDGENRTELYLIPDRCIDLELKLRKGSVEVKQRDGTHSLIREPQAVCGKPETWRKWIWFSGDVSPASWLPDSFRWRVEKTKWRRQIRLVSDDGKLVPQFDFLGLGFFVELTRIRLGGRIWWTIAFDVQPEISEASPDHTLRQALCWTLEDFPADHLRKLGESNSHSYAEWLSHLSTRLHQGIENAGSHR